MVKLIKNSYYYKTIIILILILIVILLYGNHCYKTSSILENFEVNSQIPKVIYLSYKTKNIPNYIIPNWQKIYPGYEIKLYDNEDCIKFLKDEYGQEYVDIFNFIKDGPIKADFWRVCILYKYGGIYSDIDIEPLVSIESIIDKDTTFMTSISNNNINLNPHFIVSVPKHKVLKKCIDKYLEMHRNKKLYSYWGWSIVNIMRDEFHEIFKKLLTEGINIDSENYKYQMLKEIYPTTSEKDHYCKYNNIKILNNRYSDYDHKKHNF
jgi:mannosyltransferase OCH1-like enzyme